jgi:putative endonuclease
VAGYWVYILRCSDASLYTGYTVDLKKRLARHGSGKGSKYTRSRLPVTLAYAERAPTLSSALKREVEVKRMSRSEKLLLCSYHRRERLSFR